MNNKVARTAPHLEFSLAELAEAHLLVQAHATISVPDLVDLLLDEAVLDADQGETEDAGGYALLAAQLIDAYKIGVRS